MQPYMNQSPINNERDHDFHDKCRKHLYQFVQVELKDGTIYQDLTAMTERKCILLCLKCIMNNVIITPCIMNIMIIITSCIQKMRAVADSSFLSMDHLDCLASHSLESEDLDRFSRFLLKFNRKDLHFFASLFY